MRDFVPEYFLGNAILTIFSWNALDRQGFLNFNLEKFTISIFLPFDGGIETVDKTDLKTIFPQKAGDREESVRFDPEIVGGKISDPGIDKEGVWRPMFHVKHFHFPTQNCSKMR